MVRKLLHKIRLHFTCCECDAGHCTNYRGYRQWLGCWYCSGGLW